MKNKIAASRGLLCQGTDPCHLTIIYYDDDGNPVYGCEGGHGDCAPADVVEAEISEHHDLHLNKATKKIKKALADIPPDSRGRKPSFISTSEGLLLVWVDHAAVIPPHAKVLTQKSIGKEAFLKELKVKSSKEYK